MHSSTVTGISPSFTRNSSNNLADVAARVVEEFRHENSDDYDDIFNFNDYDYDYDNSKFSIDTNIPQQKSNEEDDCDADNDIDDEFEFAASVSADQMYPLFDTSLLSDIDPNLIKSVNITPETNCKPSLIVRLPLFKLLSLERDLKSEVDDLAGVTPGTYCVWNPKSHSPERYNNSNSSRSSSRRWKFRNIFNRSNCHGKVAEAENRDHRRRYYLPSREDMVTAIATVSRSNRTLHPF